MFVNIYVDVEMGG